MATYGGQTPPRPGKVQAIAILDLIDGIVNIFWSMAVGLGIMGFGATTLGLGCLFLPLAALPLVVGVLEIVYAAKLLSNPPRATNANTALAILQIVNIIVANPLSLVSGILSLVFYGDEEIKTFFARVAAEKRA